MLSLLLAAMVVELNISYSTGHVACQISNIGNGLLATKLSTCSQETLDTVPI